MYETIKKVIESGRFELSDILKKIDTIWLQGDITDEQKTELVQLAQENANPENSYAPLQEQIDKLFKTTEELKQDIKVLSDKVTKLEGGEIEPEPPTDEYPEYKQPIGSHDAYYNVDKVTFKGKKYLCIAPENYAVVWNPEEIPSYWQEVTEKSLRRKTK